MSYATFPIAQPPTPPYVVELEDTILRSQVDGPYTITRRKYTRARASTLDFTWSYLNDANYLALMTFYESTLKNGSLAFYFTLKTETITRTYTVMFKNPPKTSYVGMGLWEVTCNFCEQ